MVLAVFGYPLAATLALLFLPGSETRVVSLPFRVLVIGCTGLALLLCVGRRQRSRVPFHIQFVLVAVAAGLTLRFIHDAFIAGRPVGADQGALDVAFFFYGVTLFPAVALIFAIEPAQRPAAYAALLWTGAFTVGLAALQIVLLNPERDAALRAQSEGLNAITFSSIGALLVLLAWFQRRPKRGATLAWAGRLALVGLGMVAMVTSASRGPAVCMLAALALAHLARTSAKRRWGAAVLIVLMFAVVGLAARQWALLAADDGDAVAIAQRLSDVSDDQSTIERLVVLNSSLDTFISNPVFGGAMVEPVLLSYPHNVILEGFMVGGVAFGLLVTFLILATARAAWRLLRASRGDPLLGFIGAHAMFVLAMSMLSGALYRSPDFWAAVALTFAYLPKARNGHDAAQAP